MLGSAEEQSEAAGLGGPPEGRQDTIPELNPAHAGPAQHCSAAAMGVGVGGGVDELQGAAAWGTCSEIGEEALGTGLEDGDPDAPLALARVLLVVAGCKAGSPVEAQGDGSSHPGGLTTGHGGSAGGGGEGGGRCGGEGGDDDGYCCY